MARPKKNNCDYFSHDNNMRNHIKVKAIRNKFPNGYAIWVMLLEYLAGADGNVFEYSDLQFELLSGDFGVSVTEIREVTEYSLRLEMLFLRNGFINSDSLDERLAPVYAKRGNAKEKSARQCRTNGQFATVTPIDTVVSVTEIPQSKVKEIKEKNIIEDQEVVPPIKIETPVKKEKPKSNLFDLKVALCNLGAEEKLVDDWLRVRAAKKGVNTETAFVKIKNQIDKSGISASDCIRIAVERSWSGFEAEWIQNIAKQGQLQFQTPLQETELIRYFCYDRIETHKKSVYERNLELYGPELVYIVK